MQFERHGRIECDGCQKGENSIALEHSKKNRVGERFLILHGEYVVSSPHCRPHTNLATPSVPHCSGPITAMPVSHCSDHITGLTLI